jgi:hypothetical protein
MFRLRQEQFQEFTNAALESFEIAVVKHLREMLPAWVRPFTDEAIRQRVRACIPRAGVYELTTQYQVLCFVDATYLLGENFDTDPGQSWSRDLLISPATAQQRADRLLEAACDRASPPATIAEVI